MKKLSRLSVLLFALLLFLPQTLVFSAAAEENPPRILVLGDSISEGYGLEGFEAGSGNPTIASYGNLVAAALGSRYGQEYDNLSVSGDTSTDLLAVLEENQEKLVDRDLILLTIGGNDLIQSAARVDLLLFGSGGVLSSLLSGVESDRTTVELSAMLSLLGSQLADEMPRILSLFEANLRSAVAKIRAASPESRILIQTVYEPFHCSDTTDPAYTVLAAVHRVIDPLIQALNSRILTLSDQLSYETVDAYSLFAAAGGSPLTNIQKGDIHPNADGHALLSTVILSQIQPTAAPDDETSDLTSGETSDMTSDTTTDTEEEPERDEKASDKTDTSEKDDSDKGAGDKDAVSILWVILPTAATVCFLVIVVILFRRRH